MLEALKQASKEAKRVAGANKLPFIAGRKQVGPPIVQIVVRKPKGEP